MAAHCAMLAGMDLLLNILGMVAARVLLGVAGVVGWIGATWFAERWRQ